MKLLAKDFCPYCERVELAIKIRKISSETIHIEYAENGNFPDNLLEINPNKTFPTLQITSKIGFAESMIIIEYLDSLNAYGPKLYGESPEKIATTKFNLEFLSTKIAASIQKACYIFGSVVEERKVISIIPQSFDLLGFLLESRDFRFFGGDDLNAEDIYIAPFILRYLAINSYKPNFPLPIAQSRAEKYFYDISHHSLIRKCIPSTDKLAVFMKNYNFNKGLNVEEIIKSPRQLVENIEQNLNDLNYNFKNFSGWKIGKDEQGSFIHAEFKFKSSELAIKAINLINEIQEASDHHSSFTLENFSILKVNLCTHQPNYGVTEMDLSFANILTKKLLAL